MMTIPATHERPGRQEEDGAPAHEEAAPPKKKKRVEVLQTPPKITVAGALLLAGGYSGYTAQLRSWWNHPSHNAETQRTTRGTLLLVRSPPPR